MNRPHVARTVSRRATAGRRCSAFPLGLLGGALVLLALAVVPGACGGTGGHAQTGSGGAGGGTGSGGTSTGSGGAAGAGLGGAAGALSGGGGVGTGGAAGAAGATGSGAGTGTGGATGAAAGGGAGASGGTAGAAGRSAGGGAGMGGSAGGAAGGAGGTSSCASAVANGPCITENLSCGGGSCTDICKPCQLLVCTSGRWQSNESAPVQCFSCGPALECQIRQSYCRTTSGGAAGTPPSYGCVDLPSACVATPTCACLSAEHVAGSCTQDDHGALTTRLLVP